MKKILSLLLAILMVGSMGLSALAGSGMNNFKIKNTFTRPVVRESLKL